MDEANPVNVTPRAASPVWGIVLLRASAIIALIAAILYSLGAFNEAWYISALGLSPGLFRLSTDQLVFRGFMVVSGGISSLFAVGWVVVALLIILAIRLTRKRTLLRYSILILLLLGVFSGLTHLAKHSAMRRAFAVLHPDQPAKAQLVLRDACETVIQGHTVRYGDGLIVVFDTERKRLVVIPADQVKAVYYRELAVLAQ